MFLKFLTNWTVKANYRCEPFRASLVEQPSHITAPNKCSKEFINQVIRQIPAHCRHKWARMGEHWWRSVKVLKERARWKASIILRISSGLTWKHCDRTTLYILLGSIQPYSVYVSLSGATNNHTLFRCYKFVNFSDPMWIPFISFLQAIFA